MNAPSIAKCLNYAYAPEDFLVEHPKVVAWRHAHPLLSKALLIPALSALSLVKVPLFPLWTLVLTVALPIIAALSPKPLSTRLLSSWVFTALILITLLAFLTLQAYALPFTITAVLLLTAFAVSGTFHVYKALNLKKLY